ncbi:GATOR complex protein MIOS-B [Cylas formicarius]|uniref:GATOR complex protein MIOS-B n=1 Tax=Cylas formicarius TaxID=197179 RepID=UPI002958645D|nr:GATOR complex protein MIOS-B [Cylas formicarius]
MAGKLEIKWSLSPRKFLSWGADNIYLYEVKPLQESSPHAIKLSNIYCADVIACFSSQHYLKCLDIYPKSDKDLLLAIGLANGKITLTNFGNLEWDAKGFPGRELVPKYARQCNAVLFNPVEHNFLASGLDKYKPDCSIMIWDISHLSTFYDYQRSYSSGPDQPVSAVEFPKPLWEFGSSESCQNLAWFYNNSKVLATGMNMKHIRLFDIRDCSKMVSSTLTKAACGVCTNPLDDRYLASYYENQIFVWDTRSIEKPTVILQQAKPVLKIGWCPTKSNLLTSLQRESGLLTLYDIQHPIVGNEEVEPTVMERFVNPAPLQQIASFSWHPTEENRILTIASLDAITDCSVFDRITLNCSPLSQLVWSCDRRVLKSVDVRSLPNAVDISHRMRERAKAKYGLEYDLYKNADMVKSDEILSNVWNWLHLSSKLSADGRLGPTGKHPGVFSVLRLDSESSPSESVTVTWAELGHAHCGGSAVYFRHDDRNRALQLCSWPADRNSAHLATFADKLEKEGAYTRAAAIAVFRLNIKLAIEVLNRAPKSSAYGVSLNVVAMALAGFSDDPTSVWRTFCASAKTKLNDPYLKTMFGFLTANGDYDYVLNEKGIAVDDRVAFACVYLPDAKLLDYLKKLCQELAEQGNLDGLLLTGNCGQGLNILQKYLDVTGDVQSTALIAVRAFHAELSTPPVQNWIANYQILLNVWKLWFERAEFDLMVMKYSNEKPSQQIYISCNYCGKSISAHLRNLRREQYTRISGTGATTKLSSCPNCRKPMPRCTICLMNMGTTISDVNSVKPLDFDNWFTWCQHCRHGGHSRHVLRWFEDHLECPMTGCTCRCFSLDYIVSKNS